MYKIYINQNVLVISQLDNSSQEVLHNASNNSESAVLTISKEEIINIIGQKNIICANPTAVFNQLKQQFTLINAAGGLVKNSQSEYLFIFRRGKWDLPKGKLDEGEDFETAAIREVQEECGITHIELGDLYHLSYHIYEENNDWILKQTNWYLMKSEEKNLIPQLEEGITQTAWLPTSQFEKVRENTYASIDEIISKLL
jgi:ADP-ribose pyrophosphatase YjhB (NUDIX family)